MLTSFSVDDSLKRYEIKSGIVVYKFQGAAKGYRVHYFDNYGMTEAIFDSIYLDYKGISQLKHKLTIRNDFKLCKIDLRTKKAIIDDCPESSLVENNRFKNQQLYKSNESLMLNAGAKQVNNSIVNGKECKVFEHHDTKKHFWKGIPVKIETQVMGLQVKMVFDDFQEIEIHDKSIFEIPAETIIDQDQKMAFSL
jgi:hypothetical protein